MKERLRHKLFGHEPSARARLGRAAIGGFLIASSAFGTVVLTTSLTATFGFGTDKLAMDLSNVITFAIAWAGFTLTAWSHAAVARREVLAFEADEQVEQG